MLEEIKPTTLVSEAATEASRVVAQAVEEAKKMVDKAATVAAEIVEKDQHQEVKITRIVSEALREAFGEQEEAQRFVDTKRIPLICKDIANINKSLDALHIKIDNTFVTKDQFSPIKNLVYGVVGLTLTAIVGAVLGLILIKN